MSLPTKPRALPAKYDPKAIQDAIQDALTAMNNGYVYVRFQMLSVEPQKLVPNMMVLADGTNWDPGSGRGLYRRNNPNTAWVFIG